MGNSLGIKDFPYIWVNLLSNKLFSYLSEQKSALLYVFSLNDPKSSLPYSFSQILLENICFYI